jgi:ribonuclease P protein component
LAHDQAPFKLVTLRRRAEFLRVRGGGRAATPRFVLEGKTRPKDAPATSTAATLCGPRFGFTVTKQIGNAVVRNRVKRRLRAALVAASDATIATRHFDNFDYVIIARADAHTCDFRVLVDDFIAGFTRVQATALSPPKPRVRKPKS